MLNLDNLTALVDKARTNDNDAIEELIRLTQNKLFFIAWSYLANDADANDVLQNSYIKAFSSLSMLDNSAMFEAWMTRIVTNCSLDFMRKPNHKYDIKFSDLSDDEKEYTYDVADERVENQPELALSQNETKRILKEIIDSLSDEQRVAVMMYFYEDMNSREIAEQLNCKETTVKARIRYAKEKIKESVIAIQKRDGIKLYNMAPLPFFIYLMKGMAGTGFDGAAAVGAATGGVAASSASIPTASTTVNVTGKAGSKMILSKVLASTAGKIAVCSAVAVGGIATYEVVKSNPSDNSITASAEVAKSSDQEMTNSEDTRVITSNEKHAISQTMLFINKELGTEIQFNPDNTYEWYDYSTNGYQLKGTYELVDDQLTMVVVSQPKTSNQACKFSVSEDSISVISGDSKGCSAGNVYQLNQVIASNYSSADSVVSISESDEGEMTTEQITKRFNEAGYIVRNMTTDRKYHAVDFSLYKIYRPDSPTDNYFYICNKDDSSWGQAKGFAFVKTIDHSSFILEHTESKVSATIDFNYHYVYSSTSADSKIDSLHVMSNGGGSSSTAKTKQEYASLAKVGYDDMSKLLTEIGITDKEMYQFALSVK